METCENCVFSTDQKKTGELPMDGYVWCYRYNLTRGEIVEVRKNWACLEHGKRSGNQDLDDFVDPLQLERERRIMKRR